MKVETTQRVLLVFEEKNIGYYDGIDTLYLVKLKPLESVYYNDVLHKQIYFVIRQVDKNGFVLFITPLGRSNRRLNAIVISSENR